MVKAEELKTQVDELRNEIINEFTKQLDKKIKSLLSKFDKIKTTAESALNLAQLNENQIESMKQNINTLLKQNLQIQQHNDEIKSWVKQQITNISKLKEKVEDSYK